MLLQRLNEYADRLGNVLPPEFYRAKQIHWVVDIAEDGTTADLSDWRVPAKQRDQALIEQVPYVQRSGTKVPPYLLVDTAEFVLGTPKADKDGTVTDTAHQEAERRHASYRELALTWADTATNDTAAQALRQYFSLGGTTLITGPLEKVEAKDTVALKVGNRWLHTTPSVQHLWSRVARERKSGGTGICLTCGEHGSLLASVPEPVKKGSIPTTGGSNEGQLVSINTAAQGRNGASQLANTPICDRCGGRAMAVLNHLLASTTHSRRFRDDGALLWWTRQDTDDSLLATIFDDQPDPATITHLINTLNTTPTPHTTQRVQPNDFHALTLGLNNARLVVREWIDAPLTTIKASLGAWYHDHAVHDGWTGKLHYLPLWKLALSCGRWTGERYAPDSTPHGLEADLLRSALQRDPLPARVLPLLLQRIHADQRIDPPRIALLQLILNRSTHPEDHVMPTLDHNSTDPAYLSGRLFAVLENIQRAALPDLNATLRDKHFRAAATSPSTTLTHLVIDSTPYFKRLRRDKPAAGTALEQRLAQIYDKIRDDLPTHMNPAQQGRFVIGYQHQRAHDLTAARKAKEAKNTTQDPDAPTDNAA